MPGANLLVVFANLCDNYEDSVVVSDEVNRLHIFDHRSMLVHQCPSNVSINSGSKVGPHLEWWRPTVAGTVSSSTIRGGVPTLSVLTETQGIEVGDKLATSNGQKIVVSSIIPHGNMMTLRDTATGNVFKPHIIISCTSVIHRSTASQVYEAWESMQSVGIPASSFIPSHRYPTTVVDNNVVPRQYKCCLLYTSPSPRDLSTSRMPSSA